jgi:hypothetical protein
MRQMWEMRMTTEPTTPREAVARLKIALAKADAQAAVVDSPFGDVTHVLSVDLRAALALFPDSPALTALKLAAVEYANDAEAFNLLVSVDAPENSGVVQDYLHAGQDLTRAARAFAKQQREGGA